MKAAIISDNQYLVSEIYLILQEYKEYKVNYYSSEYSEIHLEGRLINKIDVKTKYQYLIDNYDIVISAHCKQFFPENLVDNVRCINIHPGLNPHNRGWYPQVFSIINKKPAGATIHEIDSKLDHGKVIVQEEEKIHSYDTSLDVYNRILDKELNLFKNNINQIFNGNYDSFQVPEGNLNLKKDFNELCKLDLNDIGTFRKHIDLLRALTHGEYRNAFFIDENGDKVFVKIKMEKT